MEVKEAVRTAKNYVSDLLAEEGLINLGLEEVKFDDRKKIWNVTVGFSRRWNSTKNALTNLTGDAVAKRSYRLVRIRDNDGKVVSFTRREPGD